jgi:hypothetical protein
MLSDYKMDIKMEATLRRIAWKSHVEFQCTIEDFEI